MARHQCRARRAWAGVLLAATILTFSTPIIAQDSLDRVFDQLIRDPTSAALNFRYARLAEDKGQLRKALAAYERILARDPENERAKAGLSRIKRLLAPDFTVATVNLGAQFETNPRHFRRSGRDTDDLTLFGWGKITDQRKIQGRQWRTEGNLFANWHAEFGEINYGLAGVKTGPNLELNSEWRLRPSLGATYAWLDGKTFFVEGSLELLFETDQAGAFKGVKVAFAYDDIGRSFSARDAYRIEVSPQILFNRLLDDADALYVAPFYGYNGVAGSGAAGTGFAGDTFPLRSHQLGVKINYLMKVTRRVIVGASVSLEYRPYNELKAFSTKRRTDWSLSPGARVIFEGVFFNRHSLVVSYQFDLNESNDPFEEYKNHIVAVSSLWRF